MEKKNDLDQMDQIPESYLDLREIQSKKAVEKQMSLLADLVDQTTKGLRSDETLEDFDRVQNKADFAEPDWKNPSPSMNIFLALAPPYTAATGLPNPEYATKTGGTAKGSFMNIEAFANPSNGHLSVGVQAGVTRNADWSGGTFYSVLPDKWILGDAINTSASILQKAFVPRNQPPGTNLHVSVQFGWNPMYPSYFTTKDYLPGALANVPGLPTAPLNGFVGIVASVELAVSLLSKGVVFDHRETFNTFLNVGINATDYGEVTDKPPAPYLYRIFAFDSNPQSIINLQTSIPYSAKADEMIIETTVRLSGLRGGINDPSAGLVTAAFMDKYPEASKVSWVPLGANPFVVKNITAYTAPF